MPNLLAAGSWLARVAGRTHIGDRLVAGALLGGTAGVVFGDRDRPLSERFIGGAKIGAGVGLFAAPLGLAAGATAEAGWQSARRIVPWTTKRWAAAGAGRFATSTRAWYNPARLYEAFGTRGAFMAGGAIAGGVYGGPTGALIGAGVGLGAREAIGLAGAYSEAGIIGKAAMIGVGSAAVMGTTMALRGPDLANSVTLQPDEAGMPTYGPPGSGIRARMEAMNASGDIVLGLHNRRR